MLNGVRTVGVTMKLALVGIALLISFSSFANTPKFKICFERW